MLHNHLRNFTSHELAVHLDTADQTHDRADGVYQFRAGVEIGTHHRGGSLMPAMPFPCAKAEAVAAMMSAAERIAFLFLTMFLFINCSCFLPSKGWMVLCRAVDTLLLTLV